MAGQFLRRMFGDEARNEQARRGARAHYAALEALDDVPDPLTEREAEFIMARDSFYMATVTSDGWPYVQHRGGPVGFLRVLAPDLIGFADYPGNRQYISVGNLRSDDRVALFLMDYPARRRLKLIGHARPVEPDTSEASILLSGVRAERAMLIRVVGFDWNCPQHITPRPTREQRDSDLLALRQENANLRAEIVRLREKTR